MNYGAFKKQIESLIPEVKRFSFTLARNTDDCDDLMQQALVVALSKANQFKCNSNLKSWLLRIVYTTWIDLARKDKTITNYRKTLQESRPTTDTSSQSISYLNTCIDYEKLLSRLADKQKASFHLVCIEGYTYSETSKILGVPVGTVASRVTHSRCKLNQYFAKRKK